LSQSSEMTTSAIAPTRGDLELFIKKDHDKVKKMFEEFDNTQDKKMRLDICHQVIRELCIHDGAENLSWVAALKQYVSEDLMKQHIEESTEAEKVMYDMEQMKADDPELVTKFTKFKETILAHANKEETDWIPQLKRAMPTKEFEELGLDYLHKRAMAPPRPHPSAPKEGLKGTAAALASKPIDEMKDAYRYMTKDTSASTAH